MDTEIWHPNQELPNGYRWGIARRSRHAIHPPAHVVGADIQLVCTGALALVERSGGRKCPECVAWVRQYLSGE